MTIRDFLNADEKRREVEDNLRKAREQIQSSFDEVAGKVRNELTASAIVLHDRVPLSEVKPLTDKDYEVRGSTALLDAVEVAGHIGIDARRAVNYHADSKGTAQVFGAVGDLASAFAFMPAIEMNDFFSSGSWRKDIDKDFNDRKKDAE